MKLARFNNKYSDWNDKKLGKKANKLIMMATKGDLPKSKQDDLNMINKELAKRTNKKIVSALNPFD